MIDRAIFALCGRKESLKWKMTLPGDVSSAYSPGLPRGERDTLSSPPARSPVGPAWATGDAALASGAAVGDAATSTGVPLEGTSAMTWPR